MMNYGESLGSIDTSETLFSPRRANARYNPPEAEIISFAGADRATAPNKPHRPNQDTLLVDIQHGVYAVFDGVGGLCGGEAAALTARNTIADLSPQVKELNGFHAINNFLRTAIHGANEAIINLHPQTGTTAVLALTTEVEGQAYASIAHYGDSRAYLVRDSKTEMLTLDHSLLRRRPIVDTDPIIFEHDVRSLAVARQKLLAHFSISTHLSKEDRLSQKEQYKIFHLGQSPTVTPDIIHIPIESGDAILLTTDGIHDNLTTEEISRSMLHHASFNRADLLVKAAKHRSRSAHNRAKPDDMTAVVINI